MCKNKSAMLEAVHCRRWFVR